MLLTEREDYENFHLRVEAKINDTGNGGVWFRLGKTLGGYEAQISAAGVEEARTGSLQTRPSGTKPPTALRKVTESPVPADEWFVYEVIADGPSLTLKVNGETRQDDTTASLIFTFADLLAYITIFTTLKPGDIIVTGTPTGAGARFNPPRWLNAGDVVEISVPEIGTLRNEVADE